MLVENELKTLEKFDPSYFRGKLYFTSDDGTKNYLVFQPLTKYFKTYDVPRLTSRGFLAYTHISEWISKVLSDESIK